MTDTYKVVADPLELEKFIEYLPDTSAGEKYYVSLLTRGKYSYNIKDKNKNGVLQTFYNCTKENLENHIRRFEVPHGCYRYKGQPVDPSTLCVYMCVNPYSSKHLNKKVLSELARLNVHDELDTDLRKILASSASKATSFCNILTIDVDEKYCEEQHGKIIHEVIGYRDAYKILLTRGGFHILVNMGDSKLTKNFMAILKTRIKCDVTGESCLNPVPGCFQGDYVPRIM